MSTSPAPVPKEWSTSSDYSSANVWVSATGIRIVASCDTERGLGDDASCALSDYRTPLPELNGRSVHDEVVRYFTPGEAREIESYIREVQRPTVSPVAPGEGEPPASSGRLLSTVRRLFTGRS